MSDPQQIGLDLRDKGMAQVLENSQADWRAEVDFVIRSLPAGAEVTGEDIKARCLLVPHHPNAWGAVIRTHATRGLLQKTGEYRAMRFPAAHARMNPVYRRTHRG